MALTPHQVKLGYDVIIYGGAGLYLVYTFWRSRGKNWGYWETRWRLIPSALVCLFLQILLMFAWKTFTS
jgi:hypothetical protein